MCGIWFAAGGVAALIAASLSVGLMGQWIVFIVFSALLLVLVSALPPFLGSRQQATNADRIIGQIAAVTEPIDNVLRLVR
ncbi:MAG: NfeD family protein [Butyricicoccaceae bacterium]